MTTLRKMIQNQILDYADEEGVILTNEELRNATNGVEYCVSECMSDSVKDAFSNVMYDRESRYNTKDNLK